MKNGICELVFILDRSGSMAGMEEDTVGGYNSMLEKQRAGEGRVLVSTVLFSSTHHRQHDRVSLDEVKPLDVRDYQVGGNTALLDTIGGQIDHVALIHRHLRPEDVPEHTIFVITTDGKENASRKYSSERVKMMIKEREEEYGWEFLFVAADIDAVETAGRIGIRPSRAARYDVRRDTGTFFGEMAETLQCYRASGAIRSDWSKKFDKPPKK